MAHRFTFEALERTLRDVMSSYHNSKTIFGGKVIVFGGDFRQILPVVPRGSRSDIVHASINASKIWDHRKVLTLTQNMRLQRNGTSDEVKKFSDWILKVGEGKLAVPNDGYAEIDIPKELLIVDYDEHIHAIVQSTYPKLIENYMSQHYLQSRAILASTIEVVDQINNYVLSLIPGLPNHKITLKIGTPIMLMRNLDQSEGLCNGQSLDNVGLYLPKEVFSHGQLYVAISRVTTKEGLKILIYDKDKKADNIVPTTTTNVVFKEVFANL
ncbi:hypothetical protein TSUD_324280 [Trifolium subterraneum]|uniref:ATP-dependent DNA helicase n=1 Tax=Trifolium subterraneum TaxID=3900 RepID=A0A2Z6LJ06_TRISU|nr:hypothetical protein TSUD_324280 [Trifolium subterraneum]